MQSDKGVTDPLFLSPIQYGERGVQSVHKAMSGRLKRLNWNDLKFLAQVAGHSSLRQASKALGVSVNTVRARVSRMENALDCIIFYRNVQGLTLTTEGEAVLALALQMNMVASSVDLIVPDDDADSRSDISICCSEGLSGFWLLPRLRVLEDILPNVTFSLTTEDDVSQIHDRKHDVSIGFERPREPDCVALRLGTLHMMLFCSEGYVRRHGEPKSLDDFENHRFVEHCGAAVNPRIADAIFGASLAKQITKMKVTSSFALYSAIANDLGIGALPTYARAISRRIRPLDIPVNLRFDIWLSYDPRLKGRAASLACINWAKSCFDKEQNPWFQQDFIHPDDFANRQQDGQIVSIFDWKIDDAM
jgi:DNA-binding transcriptional LysR family regulator